MKVRRLKGAASVSLVVSPEDEDLDAEVKVTWIDDVDAEIGHAE